jgi:hypothetical protein
MSQWEAYEEGDSGPLTGLDAPLLSPVLPTGVDKKSPLAGVTNLEGPGR